MKYFYYSLGESFKNLISLIYTKIFYRDARLVRLPVYIRRRSQMKYGKGFTTGYNCRIDMMGSTNKVKLFFGKNCIIGDYCQISAREKIVIGDNLLMARNVYISDTSHGKYNSADERFAPNVPPNDRPLITEEVYIGNNVWIGANVSILPGVRIGDGCIIGANSVVNKDIPDNCIAVGSPARPIKKYSFEDKQWVKI